MSDVFLSYCREDQAIARRFAESLAREGLEVWWDQNLNAGQAFDRVTESALAEAKAVVVLWSRHAVDSSWVRAEAAQADENGTLVPVQIEPCTIPIKFKLTHTADLAGWNGDAGDPRWRSFVNGLKGTTDKGAGAGRFKVGTSVPAPLKWGKWAVAAALLLAVLGTGFWWLQHGHEAKAVADAVRPSIAVLPFDDLSPGKDQGYLADGLAEEILNSLASIPGLTVFARNSSFQFRTRGESLKDFGRTLGATHLLEGSVRKSGETLRITAQLIDARTELHIWSRTYDRPLADVFSIQEEIASEIAQRLQVSLGVGQFARVLGGTRNVEAWDAALEGSQLASAGTPDSVLQGIDRIKRAIALDPSFANAWGRLAEAYSMARQIMPDPPDGTWQDKMNQASQEARRLVPDAIGARIGDINRAMSEGKWSEVDGLYEELLKTASEQGVQINDDTVRADFYWVVGRFREAIGQYEREKARNPLAAPIAWSLGEVQAAAGNLPAALAEFDRGTQLGGPYLSRQIVGAVMTALASGDVNEIDRRLARQLAQEDSPGSINRAMAPVFHDRQQAIAELRRLAASYDSPRQQGAIAYWAAYLGDPQQALSIMGPQAVNGGWADIVRLWRPVFSDMRRLPAFKQVVTDLGLVAYWRDKGWAEPCQPIAGTEDFECH